MYSSPVLSRCSPIACSRCSTIAIRNPPLSDGNAGGLTGWVPAQFAFGFRNLRRRECEPERHRVVVGEVIDHLLRRRHDPEIRPRPEAMVRPAVVDERPILPLEEHVPYPADVQDVVACLNDLLHRAVDVGDRVGDDRRRRNVARQLVGSAEIVDELRLTRRRPEPRGSHGCLTEEADAEPAGVAHDDGAHGLAPERDQQQGRVDRYRAARADRETPRPALDPAGDHDDACR